jgi:hypothetical protein
MSAAPTGNGGLRPPNENKRAAYFRMACGINGKWRLQSVTPGSSRVNPPSL